MGSSELKHHSAPKISAVICDLDGTLLNTETVGVLKEFLARFGKVLITDKSHARVGKTQKESAFSIVQNYGLPLSPDQFIQEITPLYKVKFAESKALPGANRLIKHLHMHQIPVSLGSNSLQEYIDAKLSYHDGWKDCFCCIIGSDQVKSGKPSPDIFLEAAKRMGVDPVNCLVIEDSLVGVKAAKAADMKVVAVPSKSETDAASLADAVHPSLLEFQPELWGLPPFDDWVDGVLQIDPISLQGICRGGFLADTSDQEDDNLSALPSQVCGVYFGWAEVAEVEVFKVVVAIGSYLTPHRKIQLVLVDGDIVLLSGKVFCLKLVGYIRGFNTQFINADLSVEEVTEDDQVIARAAMDQPAYMQFKPHLFP